MERLQTLARHICNDREDTGSQALFQLQRNACRSSDSEPPGRPVLIGGMVLDVMATPSGGAPLLRGSTVPGKVRYVNGGVARNVAECMAMLGSHPLLISVVGKDPAGEALLSHWRSLHLSTEGICQVAGVSTPVVTAVFDDKGEVAAAIADVDTLEEHLSVDWVLRFSPHIRSAPVLLLDANLATPVLEAAARVAHGANVPIWFEPVSVAKSLRGASVMSKLTFISPNEAELVALSSSLPPPSPHPPPSSNQDPLPISHLSSPHSDPESIHALLARLQPHIQRLLLAGVRNVVLTLGAKGAMLSHIKALPGGTSSMPMPHPLPSETHFPEISHTHVPALAANPVNLSGAGDCLVGGAMTSVMKMGRLGGWDRREVGREGVSNQDPDRGSEAGLVAVSQGVSVAKLSVESDQNVPWGGVDTLDRVAGKRGTPYLSLDFREKILGHFTHSC